jgi:endonuclease IV
MSKTLDAPQICAFNVIYKQLQELKQLDLYKVIAHVGSHFPTLADAEVDFAIFEALGRYSATLADRLKGE